MSKNKKRSSNFIVQGGILAIAGVITRIIGMIYRIPVMNIIGTEGNGYYAAAYQVYSIMLLISSYSLPLAISKLVSARISKEQYKNAHKIFRGGILFAFITGGIACIAVFFGAEFFAGTIMSEPMSYIALRVFAPTLLIVAIMGVIRGYFQGMGTMVPTAVSQIIEQIINAVVSILAAKYLFSYGQKVAAVLREDSFAPAYGAAGSTIGTSSGALVGLLFLIIVLSLFGSSLKHQMNKDESRLNESYQSILYVIVITVIPVILSTAMYNLSDILDNGIFNKVMTLQGMGKEKTSIWGIYSGEYKLLMNVPIALSNAMSASTVPTLTSCLAAGNMKGAKKKVAAAMRFTMMIAFPCAVGLGVLALPVMSMLFEEGYELAAKLMQVGCVSIIFFSASTLSNGVLQGMSRMKIPVRNAAISLVVHVIVLFVMLNNFHLGIYAVVYANILFAVMMSVLNHLAIRKYLRYRQEIARTFIIPAISSIIMGVFIFLFYKLFRINLSNMISTILSILLGAIVYFVAILRLRGIREEEILSIPAGGMIVSIAKVLHLL